MFGGIFTVAYTVLSLVSILDAYPDPKGLEGSNDPLMKKGPAENISQRHRRQIPQSLLNIFSNNSPDSLKLNSAPPDPPTSFINHLMEQIPMRQLVASFISSRLSSLIAGQNPSDGLLTRFSGSDLEDEIDENSYSYFDTEPTNESSDNNNASDDNVLGNVSKPGDKDIAAFWGDFLSNETTEPAKKSSEGQSNIEMLYSNPKATIKTGNKIYCAKLKKGNEVDTSERKKSVQVVL